MPRKTATFQLTDADARKIDELEAAGYGTKTDIFRLALDRLHRDEISTNRSGTMPKTIEVKFDPTDLPEWARDNEDVVEFCKANLAFRVRVHRAETTALRDISRREAKAWREGTPL